MKDQFKEIVGLLRQSELRRKEAEKELKLREQAVATSLVRLCNLYYFIHFCLLEFWLAILTHEKIKCWCREPHLVQ